LTNQHFELSHGGAVKLDFELYFVSTKCQKSWCRWLRSLRRGGMDVSCECCVLSGRGLCSRPITRPEEYYCVLCVYGGNYMRLLSTLLASSKSTIHAYYM